MRHPAVVDNRPAGRFEITSDGEVAAFLDYERTDGRIVLLHTEVGERYRGLGLGEALVGHALDVSRSSGLAIEPHCSFVATHLERQRASRPRPDVSLTGIPHIGRATVIGAAVGALIAGGSVAVAMLLMGLGVPGILAAAHVGLFAGMGYGGMVGATIHADRYDRTRSPKAAHRSDGSIASSCDVNSATRVGWRRAA